LCSNVSLHENAVNEIPVRFVGGMQVFVQ